MYSSHLPQYNHVFLLLVVDSLEKEKKGEILAIDKIDLVL